MSEPAHEPNRENPDLAASVNDAALAEAGLADPAFADAALKDSEVPFAALAPAGAPATSESAAAPAVMSRPAHCSRCGADLSRLPRAARFCPRCGFDCHAGAMDAAVAEVAPSPPALLGGWKHPPEIPHVPPALLPRVSLPPLHPTSMMVEGYGNAMYRLGQRYEAGPGANANTHEALRCYSKSARLGNAWALARIASHLMAAPAQSAVPAPAPDEPRPESNSPQT